MFRDQISSGSMVIVFLGVIVDAENQIIRVPEDKSREALYQLNGILAGKKNDGLKNATTCRYPGIHMQSTHTKVSQQNCREETVSPCSCRQRNDRTQ